MKKLLFLFIIALAAPKLLAQAGDTLWIAYAKAEILGVKFSPDDRFVYVSTIRGMEKHDAVTGSLVSEFSGNISGKYFPGTAHFSANCSRAIIVFLDSIAVWDIANETLLWKDSQKSLKQNLRVAFSDISATGEFAYFASSDTVNKASLMVYNVNQRSIAKIANQKGYINSISVSPDGKYLAVAYNPVKNESYSLITLRDAASMAQIKGIDSSEGYGIGLLFSNNSKKLKYHLLNNYGNIYDIESGNIHALSDPDAGTGVYAFSRDDRFLLGTGTLEGFDSVAQIWIAHKCTQIATENDGRTRKRYLDLSCTALDISNDNSKMIVGGHGDQGLPRLAMLAPKLNEISVDEPPPAPKPYSFQDIENALSISPTGTCIMTKADIANSNGQILFSQSMNQEQGIISIDISGLASGAYFCRITCGGNVFTEGFVVVK